MKDTLKLLKVLGKVIMILLFPVILFSVIHTVLAFVCGIINYSVGEDAFINHFFDSIGNEPLIAVSILMTVLGVIFALVYEQIID